MKKIIVLGSLGMAGHIMYEYLESLNKYKIIGIARTKRDKYVHKVLDVTDFNALKDFISIEKPNIVINCIGILVAKSNHDLSTAILVNSYLPNFLSELGAILNFKLIHISTDCVFSGKEGQYKEDSFRDGQDNYGRTKILGEVINDKDLTLRTSIIGPELKADGTGLLDWFLKQSKAISGFSHAYWSGVTTLELAKQMEHFIDQNATGLYQLCPKDKVSKYDLLNMVSKVWNKNIVINKSDAYQVDKSLVCTRQDFTYKHSRPSYPNMLTELKEWIETHAKQYGHYKS